MKKMTLVLLSLSALSALPAFASNDSLPMGGIGPAKMMALTCSTQKSPRLASTSVTITGEDGYSAVISGELSGGVAQFVSPIGPFNVKISFEGNTKVYSNSEEGVELTVKYGASRVTATYKSGDATLKMTCHDEAV